MSDLNRVMLTGRTTSDITLETTSTGKTFATFTLAVGGRKKEDVDFVRVQIWENTAKNAAQYIGKGSKIGIDGHLSVRSYEKDGQKRTSVIVVAENLSFENLKAPESNNPMGSTEPYQPYSQPQASQPYVPYGQGRQYVPQNNGYQRPSVNEDPFTNMIAIDEKDLPF